MTNPSFWGGRDDQSRLFEEAAMNGLTGGNRVTRRAGAREHLLPGGSTKPVTASPPGGAVSADCQATQPPCYTPQQLRVAYGIQPLLDVALSIRQDTTRRDRGTGQLEAGS
jgi:hypothetical protein